MIIHDCDKTINDQSGWLIEHTSNKHYVQNLGEDTGTDNNNFDNWTKYIDGAIVMALGLIFGGIGMAIKMGGVVID